ncbi:peptidase inhibitor family I36 protein [Streptomyces sp. UNOB3_S3]|uniref:peptidase inhibitor family I36 protein n=1 Tax=Streptomyces sp. UNOB3_S3 TaxID=2871682 RepID=UPI001E2B0899|nr:peptidase inhibitor family I36 protein [Streptomyces sp. UNOB3_S3]MCC3775433.1 peptidase inhibitor family I36 protein [Streptomyces sp. UNOB3_S3]
MRLRRLAVAGAITIATAGSGLLTTTPASASAERLAESCANGYACLFYFNNYTGAIYKQWSSDPNYGNSVFVASSATNGDSGVGRLVRNNVRSVDNWDLNNAFTIYAGKNYQGAEQRIAAGGEANLITAVADKNESGRFG